MESSPIANTALLKVIATISSAAVYHVDNSLNVIKLEIL